jgi:hypothetical protein
MREKPMRVPVVAAFIYYIAYPEIYESMQVVTITNTGK